MAKKPYRGKLIVFEGIDGAGKGTQSKLLFGFLKKKGIPAVVMERHRGPIGKLIRDFLYKKYDFSPEIQFLLYFADKLTDREIIKRCLAEGKTVICDRYFNSTLAYQGCRGFPMDRALKIGKMFNIIVPDLVIYLRVRPAISFKRKREQKKVLDRHEADRKLSKSLVRFYQRLIKNNIFGKWVVIDGEKPIREVFEEIKLKLNSVKL